MVDERGVEMEMIREGRNLAGEAIVRAAALSQFSMPRSQFTPTESQ